MAGWTSLRKAVFARKGGMDYDEDMADPSTPPDPKLSAGAQIRAFWTARRARLAREWHNGWRAVREQGLGEVQFWVLALFIGLAAGGAAILFRLGISVLQQRLYGADDFRLATHAAGLDWWVLVGLPIIGGLAVEHT